MPPASPPPPQDLRASDAEREATVERLRVAAMEGRIDAEELDERLTAAYAARWRSELDALTADVTPPPPPPPLAPRPPFLVAPARRTTNGLAIASLCAAVFLWFGPVHAIAAVILGHAALYRIRRSGGTQKGRGLAITGLALGWLQLFALVMWAAGALLPAWPH
jgi:Domain of unknown function (DUF1707)/Domain of unknown function (DUF4190)